MIQALPINREHLHCLTGHHLAVQPYRHLYATNGSVHLHFNAELSRHIVKPASASCNTLSAFVQGTLVSDTETLCTVCQRT